MADGSIPAPNTLQPTRRDLRFNLPADRIGDWHTEAGPIFTAFLNTFSIVLPVGERFFIAAVRNYRDQITDPELKAAVTAFIGQEAMHGREHEDYNDALYAKSVIAPKFEKFVGGLLKWALEKTPKASSLSATIALEHFTALLADSVLRDARVSSGAEPRFAALWRWHALEETEHKGVAFDVWKAVMGSHPREYAVRSTGMVISTAVFWALTIPVFLEVLREQGKLTDVKGWRKFFRYTMGDIGMLRRQFLPYLDYFKRDFHPWQHDNRQFLGEIPELERQFAAA